MNKMKVFKLKFQNSLFDLNDDYERLTEHEKEKISDMDCDSFFDYQDFNDKYVCFIISKSLEIKKYSEILTKNLIIHEVIDLSNDILKFKIDIEKELKPLLSTLNSIKYSFFIDDLNDWIIENLEIDNVLDRISELGDIKKLSKIEKDYLKNFKLP
jgi:hypothetical protein